MRVRFMRAGNDWFHVHIVTLVVFALNSCFYCCCSTSVDNNPSYRKEATTVSMDIFEMPTQ